MIIIKNTYIRHKMCECHCNFLINKAYELANFIRDININYEYLDDDEHTSLQFFEDNLVTFFPNHCRTCIEKSLNIIIKESPGEIFVNPVTLIKLAIGGQLLPLASRLLEYGADLTKDRDENITICCNYLLLSNDSCITGLEKMKTFFEGGPRTYSEYIFLKKIIGGIDAYDLSLIVGRIAYYEIDDRSIFELLIKYGANLDYCNDNDNDNDNDNHNENNISLLIKIIKNSDICRYNSQDIDEIFDIILPNYNFLLEGPGINYVDPETKKSLNVLEYAQSLKNDHFRTTVCARVINYCNYRYISDAVNELLPLPIAEEVVPHIISNNGRIIEDDN